MRYLSVAASVALAALCVAPLAVRAQSAAPAFDYVEQGWDAKQRTDWYNISQGSRLIPEIWLRALEQPTGGGLFLDPAFIARYRYVQRGGGALPIGFAVDTQVDTRFSAVSRLRWRAGQRNNEPWVGFTCSACHTAQINYQGASMLIEGGPAMADFQGFFEAFNSALALTRDEPARFDRFAARVLGAANTPANQRMLRQALTQLTEYQLRLAAMNQTPIRYGFGRVDAIGHIYNKVALVARRANPTANEPDAPVSYPFLWNGPQHGRVQWNGLVANTPIEIDGRQVDPGAVGRNVGEAIGVFSDVQPRGMFQTGPTSSVDVRALDAHERRLASLLPPRWPSEVFGRPNLELVRAGRELFDRDCASCHVPIRRGDLTTRVVERMDRFTPETFDVSTPDIWMACNATVNEAQTGALRGERPLLVVGGQLGNVAPVSAMVSVLVAQTVATRARELWPSDEPATGFPSETAPLLSGAEEIIVTSSGGPPRGRPLIAPPPRDPGSYSHDERRQRCRDALSDPARARYLAYKARPLNGIWATAPYLHNGSVVSLYELLLPPAERRSNFYVGTREFDPVNVGFLPNDEAPGNDFQFVARDSAGRRVEGNSNEGHYNPNWRLTHDDRLALVEYLKVIGEEPYTRD